MMSESTKELFNEFFRVAVKMGATPFYMYNDNSFVKNLISGASAGQIEQYAKWHAALMDSVDCLGQSLWQPAVLRVKVNTLHVL